MPDAFRNIILQGSYVDYEDGSYDIPEDTKQLIKTQCNNQH